MSDYQPHGSLEIPAEVLQQIVKCISLASEWVDEPSHFTEFIRVSEVRTKNKVHILATDGFRLHLVEGEFKATFLDPEHQWFPIPAKWLVENAPLLGGLIRFELQRSTVHWKLLVNNNGMDFLTLNFDADPTTWPVNMQRIFEGNDPTSHKAVGFNVDYLSDAFKALKIWRGPSDSSLLPMAVEQLSEKDFSRFSMKNEHGVLVTVVMPILMDPDEVPRHTEDGPEY